MLISRILYFAFMLFMLNKQLIYSLKSFESILIPDDADETASISK